MLPVISSSFHGRDIFSPIAAHLASGVDFASVGPTVPIDALVRLPGDQADDRRRAFWNRRSSTS